MRANRWGRIIMMSSDAGEAVCADRGSALRGFQGGTNQPHALPGAASRARGHHGQRHRAFVHRNPGVAEPRAGTHRQPQEEYSCATYWQTRGGRSPRSLPLLGRGVLHHGSDNGYQRRYPRSIRSFELWKSPEIKTRVVFVQIADRIKGECL